jgi:hypothetical protein
MLPGPAVCAVRRRAQVPDRQDPGEYPRQPPAWRSRRGIRMVGFTHARPGFPAHARSVPGASRGGNGRADVARAAQAYPAGTRRQT